MPVLVEAFSVIIRAAAISAKYRGVWRRVSSWPRPISSPTSELLEARGYSTWMATGRSISLS